VVHLARTLPTSYTDVVEEPLLSSATNNIENIAENYTKSIKDINVNLVADHAKQVRLIS
jgi:hypothetical protein